eukprot:3365905-Alexandrium_andersonii.AAC.1
MLHDSPPTHEHRVFRGSLLAPRKRMPSSFSSDCKRTPPLNAADAHHRVFKGDPLELARKVLRRKDVLQVAKRGLQQFTYLAWGTHRMPKLASVHEARAQRHIMRISHALGLHVLALALVPLRLRAFAHV